MFDQRVHELIKQGRENEVRAVVSDTVSQFKELGPVLLDDRTTHAVRQTQRNILGRSMVRLNLIQTGMHDIAKELSAVAEDESTFLKLLNSRSNTSNQNGSSNLSNRMVVYDMEDPQKSVNLPLTFECGDVRRYLQTHGKAFYPELWARRSNKQKITPSGCLWEHLSNKQSIRGRDGCSVCQSSTQAWKSVPRLHRCLEVYSGSNWKRRSNTPRSSTQWTALLRWPKLRDPVETPRSSLAYTAGTAGNDG
ncbi:hypothetical protein M408DRAFT_333826 [Serendipita vermifera MAFF 305830]|uniref:Uncharacterized protein n=1 Tax=Serendipita vermifera MAFF 305830 TaxID=933852 RepID=A0A0C2WT98_SERVB|nr:hypothetical protein M408DRAFT_333826 [Serendipita vermifera MAFF 305830]